MSHMSDVARSSVFEAFKDKVIFICINVDEDIRHALPYVSRYQGIHHYSTDDKGINLLKITFVPNRIIVSPSGEVVQWFDGTSGKVVGGKHGKSRNNQSTHLVETIASILRDSK